MTFLQMRGHSKWNYLIHIKIEKRNNSRANNLSYKILVWYILFKTIHPKTKTGIKLSRESVESCRT